MPPDISLTLPLSQAFERAKRLLFRPFEPAKWFVIGFCAWLAQLGHGSANAGGGFNFNSRIGRPGAAIPNIQQWFEEGRSYVLGHLLWIVPLAATILLLIVGLMLLFVWLSSRGEFMFLHCVAQEKAEVRVPWHKYAREANSLFLFRLILNFGALAITLPAAAGVAFLLIPMIPNFAAATVTSILAAISLFLLSMALLFVWFLSDKLTRDFVVPIQFVRSCRCREAWGILLRLIALQPGKFVLYLLFQLVLTIAIGAMVLILCVVTCCIAWCVLVIPYIGTVVLLPILIFKRAYSVHYLAQYGREYSPVPATA